MSTGRRMPKPARREPALPAGMMLATYALSTIVVGVFGGGAVSGTIVGNGFGVVVPDQMSTTLARLAAHPADPRGAWPADPRPGPAWLTWLCIAVVASAWCAVIALVGNEIDSRLRHRHRDGLAGPADLRHIGLDKHSALRKAAREYPRLATRHPQRRSRWQRRRR